MQVPKSTLKGHREAISSVQWTKSDEVMSSSWDHTLKIWDAEYGGTRAEVVANKSIFNAHYSMLNNLVVTCGADRHIRLYDARSNRELLFEFCLSKMRAENKCFICTSIL